VGVQTRRSLDTGRCFCELFGDGIPNLIDPHDAKSTPCPHFNWRELRAEGQGSENDDHLKPVVRLAFCFLGIASTSFGIYFVPERFTVLVA